MGVSLQRTAQSLLTGQTITLPENKLGFTCADEE